MLLSGCKKSHRLPQIFSGLPSSTWPETFRNHQLSTLNPTSTRSHRRLPGRSRAKAGEEVDHSSPSTSGKMTGPQSPVQIIFHSLRKNMCNVMKTLSALPKSSVKIRKRALTSPAADWLFHVTVRQLSFSHPSTFAATPLRFARKHWSPQFPKPKACPLFEK
jgi:hypothetical protein